MSTQQKVTLYAQTAGCTSYVANGERGTTTAIDHYGAFVLLAERDAMFYIELGGRYDEDGKPLAHREVVSAREIDREEFDRITGIDKMRKEMGWAL